MMLVCSPAQNNKIWMTQDLQSHFKLPLDATRCSLRKVEFEKFSRLGEHAPPRKVHATQKRTPPCSKSGYGPEIILPVPIETDFCGVDLCVFVLVILCISRYQMNLELIQDHVVELSIM